MTRGTRVEPGVFLLLWAWTIGFAAVLDAMGGVPVGRFFGGIHPVGAAAVAATAGVWALLSLRFGGPA